MGHNIQGSEFWVFLFFFDVESVERIDQSANVIESSNLVDSRIASCESHRGSLRRAISRGVGVSAGATVWSSSRMSNHAVVTCYRLTLDAMWRSRHGHCQAQGCVVLVNTVVDHFRLQTFGIEKANSTSVNPKQWKKKKETTTWVFRLQMVLPWLNKTATAGRETNPGRIGQGHMKKHTMKQIKKQYEETEETQRDTQRPNPRVARTRAPAFSFLRENAGKLVSGRLLWVFTCAHGKTSNMFLALMFSGWDQVLTTCKCRHNVGFSSTFPEAFDADWSVDPCFLQDMCCFAIYRSFWCLKTWIHWILQRYLKILINLNLKNFATFRSLCFEVGSVLRTLCIWSSLLPGLPEALGLSIIVTLFVIGSWTFLSTLVSFRGGPYAYVARWWDREACDLYAHQLGAILLQFHFDLRNTFCWGWILCRIHCYQVPFLDWHGWHPTLCHHHFVHVGLSLDLMTRRRNEDISRHGEPRQRGDVTWESKEHGKERRLGRLEWTTMWTWFWCILMMKQSSPA